MNILILAAGKPSLGAASGAYPLCLAEFGGKALIEQLLEACNELNPERVIVAIREQEAVEFHLDKVIKLLRPEAEVIRVKGETAGAACTALLAAEYFDNEEELLILSANEWVSMPYEAAIADFRRQHLDAGTLVFRSIHPRYSYVRLEGDRVVEASEKTPLSNNATAGFYWFAKGADFVAGVQEMIRKDAHVDGRFYICPVFNELILNQKHVGIFRLQHDQYHPVKTEHQLAQQERAALGAIA